MILSWRRARPRSSISRAFKRGGTPTIPSRFLQRLEALGGDEIAVCRERGARLIDLAQRIDRPAAINKIPRPAPKPRIDLRPAKLSVTRIETLRRDPYSIYAEFILRLKPLEPLNFEPGARQRGTHMHKALEEFAKAHRDWSFAAGCAPAVDCVCCAGN